MNPQYHNAPILPRVTANAVMQVKSEVWIDFPESGFALKSVMVNPTFPWKAAHGLSSASGNQTGTPDCTVRKSSLLKGVPVLIHFTGNGEQSVYPEPSVCDSS